MCAGQQGIRGRGNTPAGGCQLASSDRQQQRTEQHWLTSFKHAHPAGPRLPAMYRPHKDLNTPPPRTHSSSTLTSAPAATSAAAHSQAPWAEDTLGSASMATLSYIV